MMKKLYSLMILAVVLSIAGCAGYVNFPTKEMVAKRDSLLGVWEWNDEFVMRFEPWPGRSAHAVLLIDFCEKSNKIVFKNCRQGFYAASYGVERFSISISPEKLIGKTNILLDSTCMFVIKRISENEFQSSPPGFIPLLHPRCRSGRWKRVSCVNPANLSDNQTRLYCRDAKKLNNP